MNVVTAIVKYAIVRGSRVGYFITQRASKWARINGCDDGILLSAIHEMENGLCGNALGSGVYKKRIAVPGRGKSGGWRVIIATKLEDHWFVLHGYAKNVQDNISDPVLRALRLTGKMLLSFDNKDIDAAVNQGIIRQLSEVNNER